jgi:hypothetical protein
MLNCLEYDWITTYWMLIDVSAKLSTSNVNLRGLGVLVFNATFNNISVISWWSVLLVEETRVSGENHRPAASHWTNFIT